MHMISLFTVARSAMRVFLVVRITLICMVVLIGSISAVVGVFLIRMMVSLRLGMRFT